MQSILLPIKLFQDVFANSISSLLYRKYLYFVIMTFHITYQIEVVYISLFFPNAPSKFSL